MSKKLIKLVSLAFMLVAVTGFADNKPVSVDHKQNSKTVDFFYYGPGADESAMTAIILDLNLFLRK